MATPRNPVSRLRGIAVVGMTLIGLTASLTACSSGTASSRPAAAAKRATSAAVRSTCSQVTAVLSDGPDPDSDPVGYAEAQILPLGQIHTTDAALRSAIGRLASAYKSFFASNGTSGSAKLAVAAASKQVNAICPGAAS
ncbi:MAG TPA: hypothetical protein VMC03_05375 [Streptosporangiaceae bacterium]|nr:hypothetical protein [Streptosporangiaceae bacterium]